MDPLGQARLRLAPTAIEVQSPLLTRVVAMICAGWGVLALALFAPSDRTAIVPGAIALLGGIVMARHALRVRPVLDADGLHAGRSVTARSEILEIVLFRGRDRRAAFLRMADGRRLDVARAIPGVARPAGRSAEATIELFCHLQHDLAHALGWEPIPVRIDLGPGEESIAFDHPCDRCSE